MLVVALILGIMAIFAYGLVRHWMDEEKRRERRAAAIVTTCLVAMSLFALLFTVISLVPAGSRGVVMRFNTTTGRVLNEGLQFKNPVDKIILMNVKTQLYTVEATAASKDLQDVATSIGLNYKVMPDQTATIYRTIGMDYIEVIAHPLIQETVKEITAKFNAEDMILKRADVKVAITEALKTRLAERGIVAEAINITDFNFSEQFTAAIEAKVVAIQKVLEAENKLRQIEVEARQAEQRAKGEAAALIANANGKAEAIKIVTDAQVKANEAISASLTADLLQYIFIDRLSSNIKIVVVPSGSAFVLPELNP